MRLCATTLEPEMSPGEHALLRQILCGRQLSGAHLEIGTAAGGTLCAMLACYPAERRPPFVVVDPMTYFPGQRDIVARNLREHGFDPAAVDFREHLSAEAWRTAASRQESFDFILIDGCHKVRAVTQDLRWTRLLRVGGVICFHDYSPEHRGVLLAVSRFLREYPNYAVIGQAGSLLAVEKRAPSRRPEVSPGDTLFAWLCSLPLQVERRWKRWTRPAANKAA